ncbi:hypothetical protein Mapa_002290 [Marchantia paleacea]|nr:hypothetical protein Mapa_002290 [Marchantia paleacea]
MQGGAVQHASAYGVKYQARSIAPYVADPQRTRFLVGTQSLREENEVHVITLPDNSSDIVCEGLYTHQNEIWDLAICPFEPQIISTVYASVGEYGAGLWRIPDRSRGGHMNVQPLQNVASLDGHKHTIKCTLWWPSGKHNQLLSIDAENLFIWDVNTAQRLAKVETQLSAGELHHMAGGAWDPHDVTNVATSIESSVQMWDLRSMKQSSRIEQAHAIQVRDIDFNPKNEHILITAGDDSKIRVWDLKMLGMPLRELPGHSHWTWRVRYNPTYEELVLSAGTDSVVNLWHVIPVSSSESKPKSPYGSPKGPLDSLLRAYTEHEDSVYGIAWSARDPWVFASLSYDGRVMVDSVPQNIRKQKH